MKNRPIPIYNKVFINFTSVFYPLADHLLALFCHPNGYQVFQSNDNHECREFNKEDVKSCVKIM